MNNKSLEPNDIVSIKLRRWQIPILLVSAGNSLESHKDNPCFLLLKKKGQDAKSIEVDFVEEIQKIIKDISAQSNMNINKSIPLDEFGA